MKCPGYNSTFRTITYEGICSGCGGEWLDTTELGHIARVCDTRFTRAQRDAVSRFGFVNAAFNEILDLTL